MLINKICDKCGSEMKALFYSVFCDCDEIKPLNGTFWLAFTASPISYINTNLTVILCQSLKATQEVAKSHNSGSVPVYPILTSKPVEWVLFYGYNISRSYYYVRDYPCFSAEDRLLCFTHSLIKDSNIANYAKLEFRDNYLYQIVYL